MDGVIWEVQGATDTINGTHLIFANALYALPEDASLQLYALDDSGGTADAVRATCAATCFVYPEPEEAM